MTSFPHSALLFTHGKCSIHFVIYRKWCWAFPAHGMCCSFHSKVYTAYVVWHILFRILRRHELGSRELRGVSCWEHVRPSVRPSVLGLDWRRNESNSQQTRYRAPTQHTARSHLLLSRSLARSSSLALSLSRSLIAVLFSNFSLKTPPVDNGEVRR